MRCRWALMSVSCMLFFAARVAAAPPSASPGSNTTKAATSVQTEAAKRKLPITISRETTYITAPLRADGYPDYVAALDEMASQGVTTENNAAVLLLEAVGPASLTYGFNQEPLTAEERAKVYTMLGMAALADNGEYFVNFIEYVEKHDPEALKRDQTRRSIADKEFARAGKRPWQKKDCPLVAAWLRANEEPLDKIVEASRRPRFYLPLIPKGTSWDSVTLAFLSINRPLLFGESALATWRRETTAPLVMRAMLRTAEGRFKEAWGDLLACHRLARLVAQVPALDAVLMASRWEGAATVGDGELAHYGQLTAEQAKQCLADLRGLPRLPSIIERFDVWQRFEFLDAICAIASRRTNAAEIFGVAGRVENGWDQIMRRRLIAELDAGKVDWDSLLRFGNQHYDQIAAALRKPDWREQDAALVAIDKQIRRDAKKLESGESPEEFDRWLPAEGIKMLPATDPRSLLTSPPTNLFMERASQMVFAIAAWRAVKHRYPNYERDLFSIKILDRLPADPYDRKRPLGYSPRWNAKPFGPVIGYCLSSVGPNGKWNELPPGVTKAGLSRVEFNGLHQPFGPLDKLEDNDDLVLVVPAPDDEEK